MHETLLEQTTDLDLMLKVPLKILILSFQERYKVRGPSYGKRIQYFQVG